MSELHCAVVFLSSSHFLLLVLFLHSTGDPLSPGLGGTAANYSHFLYVALASFFRHVFVFWSQSPLASVLRRSLPFTAYADSKRLDTVFSQPAPPKLLFLRHNGIPMCNTCTPNKTALFLVPNLRLSASAGRSGLPGGAAIKFESIFILESTSAL